MKHRWGSDRESPGNAAASRAVPDDPDVADQLRTLDCDPIAGMARLAQDESQPTSLWARMYAELANYVAPRRKAIELTGPAGSPVKVDVSNLSNDELRTLEGLLRRVMVDA